MPKLTLTDLLYATPEGESFFWPVEAKVVCSYAQHIGVKITTQKYLAVGVTSKEVAELVKVTVIKQTDQTPRPRGRTPKP